MRPKSIAFAIHGPICRDDLPGLCDRVCATFRAEMPEVAFCDGCQVRLRRAAPELLELVELMGLRDVLPE